MFKLLFLSIISYSLSTAVFAMDVDIAPPVFTVLNSPVDSSMGDVISVEERGRSLKRRADRNIAHFAKRSKITDTVPIFPCLLDGDAIRAEMEYLSSIRCEFIKKEYENDCSKKGRVLSPDARQIWREQDTGNYFNRADFFKNRRVLQADHLFDPETNLDRMKKGLAPLAYNGDRIEIHHVTQRDRGIPEDPLCEMTRNAHMGFNAHSIIEQDTQGGPSIVHADLSKDEARLMCGDNQYNVCNVLHFREGPSLIDRDDFNSFRIEYWKHRAEQIEQGNFIKSIPLEVELNYVFERL